MTNPIVRQYDFLHHIVLVFPAALPRERLPNMHHKLHITRSLRECLMRVDIAQLMCLTLARPWHSPTWQIVSALSQTPSSPHK